jgi:hypothetical protein
MSNHRCTARVIAIILKLIEFSLELLRRLRGVKPLHKFHDAIDHGKSDGACNAYSSKKHIFWLK